MRATGRPASAPKRFVSRDASSAKTLSILFAVIALLVVVATLIWRYFVPRRHPSDPGQLTSTRFDFIGNRTERGTTPPYRARFPAHPAVRGIVSARQVSLYDPHTQTPFPSHSMNDSRLTLTGLNTQNGDKSRYCLWKKLPLLQYERPESTVTFRPPGSSGFSSHIVSHNDDCIQPTQLPLIARTAGRAHPLTGYLNKFPLPSSASWKRLNAEAHSSLFLEKLDMLDVRTRPVQSHVSFRSQKATFSNAGSGSYRTKEGSIPIILELNRYSGNSEPLNRPSENDRAEKSNPALPEATILQSKSKSVDCPGKAAAMSGLGSSLSNSNDKSLDTFWNASQTLEARTPPSQSQAGCEEHENKPIFQSSRRHSLRRYLTPSTEPLTVRTSEGSVLRSPLTPNTSPAAYELGRGLLPVPLRLRKTAVRPSLRSPTFQDAESPNQLPQETQLVFSPLTFGPPCPEQSLKSKRFQRTSLGFHHPEKAIAKRITKPRSSHVQTDFKTGRATSQSLASHFGDEVFTASGTSRICAPVATKNSWEGSSIYSRDANGMSYLRSSTLAEKISDLKRYPEDIGSPEPTRRETQTWYGPNEDHISPNSHTFTFNGPSSETGLRSPVLSDANYDFSNPLSARPLCQRFSTFDLTMPIGRQSDDVFSDDSDSNRAGHVLKRVLDVEMASCSEDDMSRFRGRSAPGGAEWI